LPETVPKIRASVNTFGLARRGFCNGSAGAFADEAGITELTTGV